MKLTRFTVFAYSVMNGKGTLEACGDTLTLKKGDSIFIPAGSGEYTIKGNLDIIETRI